jgi:hypothetical protein
MAAHCSEILSGKLHGERSRLIANRREIAVSRKVLSRFLIALSAVLVMSACRARAHSLAPGSVTTQTVAPAAAQPAPTGTDAMTQTVNVDDGRSEEEGATAVTDTTVTTVAKPAKPVKTAKKHR